MKLSQKNIIRIILLAAIALYNTVLFSIVWSIEKTPVFWVSYGFIMFVPIFFLLVTFFPMPFTSGTNLALSLPLIQIIGAYAGIEFAVGTLFMLLQTVAPIVLAVILQVAIFLICTIIFFVTLLGAKQISNSYNQQKTEVFALNQIYAKVSATAAKASPAVASKLNEVAEKIKYSDYHSYPELNELDADMKNTISGLQVSLDDDAMAMKLAIKLDLLVDERNEMLKQIKKLRG